MFPGRPTAKIPAGHHHASFGETGSDVFIHSAQAVTADFFGVYDIQIPPRIDLIRIDIVSHYDDFSCYFCFHLCFLLHLTDTSEDP